MTIIRKPLYMIQLKHYESLSYYGRGIRFTNIPFEYAHEIQLLRYQLVNGKILVRNFMPYFRAFQKAIRLRIKAICTIKNIRKRELCGSLDYKPFHKYIQQAFNLNKA